MARGPHSLARSLSRRPATVPAGTERFHGFGVPALTTQDGHVVAFQSFVRSSIGPPFTSVWHRRPDGRCGLHINVEPGRTWARHLLRDGVHVDDIDVVWKSRTELSLFVARARLHLALRLAATPATLMLSGIAGMVPSRAWRSEAALRFIERMAVTTLGAAPLSLSGVLDDGQRFRIRPAGAWQVEAAVCVIGGRDVGGLVHDPASVHVGRLKLPGRPLFIVGTLETLHAARGPRAGPSGEG